MQSFDCFNVRSAQLSRKSATHLSNSPTISAVPLIIWIMLLTNFFRPGHHKRSFCLHLLFQSMDSHCIKPVSMIAVHYGWPLCQTPAPPLCLWKYIDHVLKVASLYHNKNQDLTVSLLIEVYHQVQVEPELQVVSTKKVIGWTLLWMAFEVNVLHEHCFMDVQVFNPYAPSYVSSHHCCIQVP